MPEIGETLRDARMRARIDVSEIEAKTKIRAKYLRALENEEWGLLPGPTFVKSFLRTYAQALGLDGKALVEEYRLSHEHPSEAALEPIVSSPQRSRARGGGPRPGGSGPSRAYLAIVGAIVLLIVLLIVGLISQSGGGSKSSSARSASQTSAKGQTATGKHRAGASSSTSPSSVVALSLHPSAAVYVCLIGDNGRKVISGRELQAGESTPTYHARRFVITLGNSSVTMFVDGRARSVPASSQAIGYTITKASGRKRLHSGQLPDLRVSTRAGIVVTGTEVLTGRVSDRNGPWLSDRLRELGVDLAHISIVGDRPQDMRAALEFMAEQGMDLVLTSGGLGPTADDVTAEVVGAFQGREMVLDEALEHRIGEIVRPLLARWPDLDVAAVQHGTRKQATIPAGATVLEPIGTAPGLVVAPLRDRAAPTVVVLPGPPRELQPMWQHAVQTDALRAAVRDATTYRQRMLRLFGIPESEIAETLRVAEREGVELDRLEITTCLKRGEIEVVTRYEPDSEGIYEAFAQIVSERHADTLFSDNASTVDDQVAELIDGHTIATAESCTGGLLAARLTDRAGSSRYVKGAIVAYSNDVKVKQAGVPAALIERHGAVSAEVAQALAAGARERLHADVGVGVTGIAGPDGGSEDKPVGLVWLSVSGPSAAGMTRSVNLPGGRADVRDRATTVAMHMLRRVLLGA